MESDEQLLAILARPGFHSGTDLGRLLGVSRVAIQKRMAKLRTHGLPILRIPGRGYSLEKGVTLLDRDTILSLLSEESRQLVARFDLLQSVSSTSDYVSDTLPESGHAAICITESQQEGRGRRGRDWISTPYRNLIFSMCWCFDAWPDAITGISLAAGIEVARTLKAAGIDDVKVKWPNDLVVSGRKIAGILIDVRGEANSGCVVVMGLGVNFALSRSDGRLIDQPWTDLKSLGHGEANRNRIASGCIDAWVRLCKNYQTAGFRQYRQDWPQYDVYNNCDVRVRSSRGDYSGRVCGVNETGQLIVREPGGATRFLSDTESSIILL